MIIKLLITYLTTFGEYLILMGRTFRRPERMCVSLRRYVKEMCQSGIDSIPLVSLISPFVGVVICIQMEVNIQSPWMPRWTTGYVTHEIFLLEFTNAFMYLILTEKVGLNIASELGIMRVTRQIGALNVMGVNPASYLIPPKTAGLITIMPFLVIFSSVADVTGACGTAYSGVLSPDDLMAGLQYPSNVWFVWMNIIKGIVFAFIIAGVSSFYGYSVRGGSVEMGETSTNVVVSSSMLALFADMFLTPLPS